MNIYTAVSTWWNTPSLSTAVHNAKTLAELHAILEHGKSEENPEPATGHLSFCAQDHVSVKGYSGCVLDFTIEEKILQIVKWTVGDGYTFPEAERPHGQALVDILHRIYAQRKPQYENAYRIVKIFFDTVYVLTLPYYHLRYTRAIYTWGRDYDCVEMFDKYTRQQYIERGQKPPTEPWRHSGPERYYISRHPQKPNYTLQNP